MVKCRRWPPDIVHSAFCIYIFPEVLKNAECYSEVEIPNHRGQIEYSKPVLMYGRCFVALFIGKSVFQIHFLWIILVIYLYVNDKVFNTLLYHNHVFKLKRDRTDSIIRASFIYTIGDTKIILIIAFY